ncbi:MAG: tetratricopeptide repeat protein [Deltaproteobacteria bacterium]|nr:tetratricopeptide repeat protein [Deltaproteobacteria bacterium]
MRHDQAAGTRWLLPIFERRVHLALGLLIVTAALFVFWPSRRFGFVYDDFRYVVDNPLLKQGLSWQGIRGAFRLSQEEFWLPAVWLSYMADVQICGLLPQSFHLTNILLHSANALVLFLVLADVTGAPVRSALATALFAVHPLRVESVAWITERKDVLSTLFLLLAIGAYVKYARTRLRRWFAAVVALFAAGLMAKPMLVSLPLLLLVLDYWPLGRLRENTAQGSAGGREEPWKVLVEKAPLAALSVLVSLLTLAKQRGVIHVEDGPAAILAPLGRAATAYVLYLCDALWPHRLALSFYDRAQAIPIWAEIAAAAALLGACSAVVSVRRRFPYAAAGWAWYVVSLLPVSGIVPVGRHWVADRFTYLPHIGLAVLVVWLGADLAKRLRLARSLAVAVGVVVAVALALLSAEQLRYWRDGVTLLSRTVQLYPRSAEARLLLADAYRQQGDRERAAELYRQTIALDPGLWESHFNLASILKRTGHPQEAVAHLEEALRLDPVQERIRYALADALLEAGRLPEAEARMREFLQGQPDADALPSAYNLLGLSLLWQGEARSAAEAFGSAVRLEPRNGEARYNLAVALGRLGRHDEAIALYREAVELAPNDLRARLNLAENLFHRNRFVEAEAEFGRAAGLAPGSAESHFAQGRILAGRGDAAAAREAYLAGLGARAVYPQIRGALAREVENLPAQNPLSP